MFQFIYKKTFSLYLKLLLLLSTAFSRTDGGGGLAGMNFGAVVSQPSRRRHCA